MLKRNTFIFIAFCIIALLAGFFLSQAVPPGTPQLQTATLFPEDFRPLADFELSDHSGQTFNRHQFEGKWSLVFFGYTFCPDICPMTLSILNEVEKNLQRDNVQTILVSVDPTRDTPDRLHDYLAFFNPEFIGLTDTTAEHSEIKKLAGSLGVFYSEPSDSEEENYLVDHSAGIFLINPRSRVHALFSAPHHADIIARDIEAIIN